MLRGKGSAGTSLLADAAINSMRGVDLFDVVLETVQENLSKEQVRQRSVFKSQLSRFVQYCPITLVGGPYF